MTDIATLENDLNQHILSGDIMGAFDRFYADECVMVEPGADPHVGKETNRQREQEFVDSVGEFHAAEVKASAISGDVSFSEWEMDITFKDGTRKLLQQVAVRRWQDGKVAHERFYYDAD